jgi:hypothetical protein
MDATLKSKVSEVFLRYKLSKEDAGFISEVLNEIDDRQDKKFEESRELFLTQKDKVDLIDRIRDVEVNLGDKITRLHKSIYTVGLVQFLAIMASVLLIVNFMLK